MLGFCGERFNASDLNLMHRMELNKVLFDTDCGALELPGLKQQMVNPEHKQVQRSLGFP